MDLGHEERVKVRRNINLYCLVVTEIGRKENMMKKIGENRIY